LCTYKKEQLQMNFCSSGSELNPSSVYYVAMHVIQDSWNQNAAI